jgi:hypothetical protein
VRWLTWHVSTATRPRRPEDCRCRTTAFSSRPFAAAWARGRKAQPPEGSSLGTDLCTLEPPVNWPIARADSDCPVPGIGSAGERD